MKAIVGYTGFVGSNIDRKADFDRKYNSKNIAEAYGTRPDFLLYAGVRAEKYLANHQPEKDLEQIQAAFDNICRIDPKKLVLISSIDVYESPVSVDEQTVINPDNPGAYGRNRFYLEQKVRERYPDALIVRLPGLFGTGIKKNFVYDFIKRIPFMLTEAKLKELCALDDFIAPYYLDQHNGFYQCSYANEEERLALKAYFERIGFSALQFTDSRSVFQFYPLDRLWGDIETVLWTDVRLINLATEPVSAAEVYRYVCGGEFVNELGREPARYDIHTRYGSLFGSATPYILDKQTVLRELKAFIEASN